MKIAASIYSSNETQRNGLIQLLDEHRIDYFHVDSNDDLSVFDDIRQIRQLSKTPVDLHIISDHPEKYFEKIREYAVENVTIQYENLKTKPEIPDLKGTIFGLAIRSETPISVFQDYADSMDFILFMATTPGKSGGVFQKENFRKIHDFSDQFPVKHIHVDGGVNAELSFILRNMNVRLVVVGSYLFKSEYVGASLLNLKHEKTASEYKIRDFMKTTHLPLLPASEAGFRNILESIEQHNLGFTIITGKNNYMEGIVTNADIRRALIKNFDTINKINAGQLINSQPIFISQDKSVNDLWKLVEKINFPLLFLPVTNDLKQVVGVLMFNNLIKGES